MRLARWFGQRRQRRVSVAPVKPPATGASASCSSGVAPFADALLDVRDAVVSKGVAFAPAAYRVLWAGMLGVHTAVAAAYAQECVIYVQTAGNPRMDSYLQHFGVSSHLRADVSSAMIATSAAIAAWHVAACLRAIFHSLRLRRLVFGRPWRPLYSFTGAEVDARQRKDSVLTRVKRTLCFLYAVAGVRSKFFDAAFNVREVVDIASQSFQAFQICSSVADPMIPNLAVVVLVLSCWSTPVLRLALRRKEVAKRLLCLALDVFFDLCFTIGLPFQIFAVWNRIVKGTFSDPVLVVRNAGVLSLLLVNSWRMFVASRIPALSTIVVLESVKSLIKVHSASRQLRSSARSSRLSMLLRRKVEPSSSRPTQPADRLETMLFAAQRDSTLAVVDVAFALFGGFVLVVYCAAIVSALPEHQTPGCKLQMRPWLELNEPCAVLEIDCAQRGLSGSLREMDLALQVATAHQLQGLAFANCPELHVPPRIRRLPWLLMLTIFNSTIVEWSDQAALDARLHPHVSIVLLVRANLSGIPAGLLSERFPPTVVDFRVHESNLTALPDELIATRWPSRLQNFVVERSLLTRVPRFLAAMHISSALSLAGNRIASVSLAEILSTACNRSFLGHNPLRKLELGSSRPLSLARVSEIHLEHSAVDALPEWTTAPLSASGRSRSIRVFASASPLCDAGASNVSSSGSVVQITCSPPAAGGYYESLDTLTQILSKQ